VLPRLFLPEDLKIAEEEQENMSLAEIFASLSLETRFARIEGGNNESRQLKPSIFERLGYKEVSS
jgi:hypothetical protein